MTHYVPNIEHLEGTNGKALVIRTNGKAYLQSYNTIVCSYDYATEQFERHWEGYSMTTGRHLTKFFEMFSDWRGGSGMKDKFYSLPYKKVYYA